MHIIEIILDGFKSYSTRTIVGEFDPQFNAITGLNGSGKSNILDAICFVLGITRLASVRAENLQELIYKQGNSGVQKASVSITFSNVNKAHSPPGFEESDKIQVTRTVDNQKSKYYINGRSENLEKVKNLFCSVKLNVNNPHFLIMQGRVTKVINMKPMEILGLIEEAAGISLYQKKKEETIQIIKKKENKLMEIKSLLENEVTPQLQKLKEERETFQEFKSNENYLDELHKQIVAYHYLEYQQFVHQKDSLEDQHKERTLQLGRDRQREEDEIETLKRAIGALDKNGTETRAQELKNMIVEQGKVLYQLDVEMKTSNENLQTMEIQRRKLAKSIDQATLMLEKFEKQVKEVGDEQNENLKNDLARKKEQLREMELQLGQLKEGKQVENLEEKVHAQIRDMDIRISNIVNKKKALLKEQEMKKQEITSLEQKLADKDKDKKESERQLENMQNRIAKLQQQRGSYQNSVQAYSSLQAEIAQVSNKIQELGPKIQHYSDISNRISFNFKPIPGIDRSQVKGKLINLIRVKDYKKYGAAIQGVAGGNLWSVIVENELVSKELLKRNAVPYRVSYLPLNKIRGEVLGGNQLQEIKRLTHDKAYLALELIEYDPVLEPAMRFVFGSTFVVEDETTAKKVTYNMGKRSVTLKGDTYNPSGILSGGFSSDSQMIQQVQELKELERIKFDLHEQKRQLEFKLEPLAQEQRQCQEMAQQLQNEEMQLKLYEERKAQASSEGFTEERLVHTKEEIADQDKKLSLLDDNESKLKKQVQELKQELDGIKKQGGNAKSREEFFQRKIKDLKKEKEEIDKQMKENDNQGEQLALKMEEAKKDLKTFGSDLEKVNQQLEEENKNLKKQKIFKSQEDQKLEELNSKMKQVEAESSRNNSEKNKMNTQVNFKEQKLNEIQQELKQSEETLKKTLQQVSVCETKLQKLEEENKWIQKEREQFGQRGTKYDFQNPANQIHQLKEAQKKIAEQNEDLKKRVNLKVDAMFEDSEKQYEDLQRKKEITQNNKREFEETIEKLDQQKNKDIEKTWMRVNQYCSEIYSTLLQGANAKLCPQEGKSVHEGLELRVAFSGTWKDSLSELSGGQRSLLALSLILALLKYHPAPLYILDEIDSALDLSHTQNIGIMIRKFFMNSQFIIVSLKEGLFQNANVLFKVAFLDNKSTVKRFQVRKNDNKAITQQEAGDDDEIEAVY